MLARSHAHPEAPQPPRISRRTCPHPLPSGAAAPDARPTGMESRDHQSPRPSSRVTILRCCLVLILSSIDVTSGPRVTAADAQCPAHQGWADAGSFDALVESKEPWHGSKRVPTSVHSERLLRQMLPASVLEDIGVTCTADGDDRCFLWNRELFKGVPVDYNIEELPKTEVVRALQVVGHVG